MRKLTVCALLVVVVVGTVAADERDALRHLTAIRVVVEDVGGDGQRHGVTEAFLKTTVELRLRQNDVPLDDAVTPFLYVGAFLIELASTDGRPTNECVWHVGDLEVRTTVILDDGSKAYTATIWDVSGTFGFLTDCSDAKDKIRSKLQDQLDEFINDWLATHPKE